jgi:hypothetical protein
MKNLLVLVFALTVTVNAFSKELPVLTGLKNVDFVDPHFSKVRKNGVKIVTSISYSFLTCDDDDEFCDDNIENRDFTQLSREGKKVYYTTEAGKKLYCGEVDTWAFIKAETSSECYLDVKSKKDCIDYYAEDDCVEYKNLYDVVLVINE